VAYPRSQRARSFKTLRRQTTDVVINNVAWTAVDTGLDIALPAQVGDVMYYAPSFLLSNANVIAYFDVATIVSSAIVNRFSNATQGWGGWWSINSSYVAVSGEAWYTVTAGDLASGLVTLRLLYQTASATNRTVYASVAAGTALDVAAQNRGPGSPH
jgi:hypothetical protein